MGKVETGWLGERIAALREQRGMSQSDMARALNYPSQTWSNYENGNRRIRTVDIPRIARVLGVSISELYGVPSPSAESLVDDPSLALAFQRVGEADLSDEAKSKIRSFIEFVLAEEQRPEFRRRRKMA